MRSYGPLHNLLIERCRFRARSGGIHFGASSWYGDNDFSVAKAVNICSTGPEQMCCHSCRYDYVNVTIRDTVVLDAHGGLNVQTRGPGSVRNLTVTNFMVSHAIFDAPCQPWMGNAQLVAISADRWCGGPAPCDENGGPPAGTITVRSFGSFSQLLWFLSSLSRAPYNHDMYVWTGSECRVGKHHRPVGERHIHIGQGAWLFVWFAVALCCEQQMDVQR